MEDRDYIIEQLIKEKGGTKEDYERIMNSIAYHESAHTLDPTIKQYGGGPGRGKYQFEVGDNRAAITAARRAKTYYKQIGLEIPRWLKEATKGTSLDASKLTSEQQDILFLSDMKIKPDADFAKVINGEQSIPEFWAKHHWAGKNSDYHTRLKSFNESFESFKNKHPEQLNHELKSNPGLFKKSYYSDDVVEQMQPVRDNIPSHNQPRINNIAWESSNQAQQQSQQPQEQPQPQQQNTRPTIDPNVGMDQLMQYITQRRAAANQPGPQPQGVDKELTRYNVGGTHEQNPLGGIPIGNNSVEAPETSFNLPFGKFVFSDRITTNGMKTGAKQQVSNSYNNQFADGGLLNGGCGGPGQPPCPPITVKDKNDPRYIAYKDSLALYNNFLKLEKALKNQNYSITSGGKDIKSYIKEVEDNNQLYQQKNEGTLNSVADFVSGIINHDLPRQLYSNSINPNGTKTYKKKIPSDKLNNVTTSRAGDRTKQVPIKGTRAIKDLLNLPEEDYRVIANYSNVNPRQKVIVEPNTAQQHTEAGNEYVYKAPERINPKVQSTNSLQQQGPSFSEPSFLGQLQEIKPAYWEVNQLTRNAMRGYDSEKYKVYNPEKIEYLQNKEAADKKSQTRGIHNKTIIKPIYSFAQGGYMNTIQPLNLNKKTSSKKKK